MTIYEKDPEALGYELSICLYETYLLLIEQGPIEIQDLT